jgi:hypothetical protein
MNTANLQIEGLMIAFACILRTLRDKGVLSDEELLTMFVDAETSAGDDRAGGGRLRPANADAVLFPLRFLREAVRSDAPQIVYSEIVAAIGRRPDDGLHGG